MRADEVFALLNRKIQNIHVSGGGISDYKELTGKPQINGITLQGNKSLEDIGIEKEIQDIDFSGYFVSGR